MIETQPLVFWPKEFEIKPEHFGLDQLPQEWLELAYEQKWFKPYISKRYNGLGSTLREGLQILMQTSAIHPSLGWAVNLGAGANYFSGFYSHSGAKKVFSRQDVVLAGSGSLAQKFEKVEGGYIASGKWSKATGAAHATGYTMNGQLKDGTILSCTLDPEQVKVENDWNLFALKPTSSHAFSAENAFIPEEFTFRINHLNNAFRTPVHQIPFMTFARLSMMASFIGIAEGFLDQIDENKLAKPKAFKAYKMLINLTKKNSEEVLQLADKCWSIAEQLGDSYPEDEIEMISGRMGKTLFDALNEMYYRAGMWMADEKNLAHHFYKDALMAAQHSLLKD